MSEPIVMGTEPAAGKPDGWYLYRECGGPRYWRANRIAGDRITGGDIAGSLSTEHARGFWVGPLPEDHELIVEANQDSMGRLLRDPEQFTPPPAAVQIGQQNHPQAGT